jgi:hypothetical protein
MKNLAQSIDDRIEARCFQSIEFVILQVDVVNYLRQLTQTRNVRQSKALQ